jgi:hypothetical protein
MSVDDEIIVDTTTGTNATVPSTFQRSHNSAFCFAVNRIRDVTMAHLLIQKD